MPLDRIDIDWVWLKDNLNKIIDEVNSNKPLGSATIAVNEAENGSLLSIIAGQQPGGGGGLPPIPDGSTPNWHTISIKLVDSSGNCQDAWIWYWGTSPIFGFPLNPQ
jgi:hypothetical protein